MQTNFDSKEVDEFMKKISANLHTISYINKDDEKFSISIDLILEEIKKFVEHKSEKISHLNEIGTSLSTETKIDNLLDMIISKGKLFTNADGGTLYMMSEDEKSLIFRIVETDSLNIKMGANGEEISWPPLPIHQKDGTLNRQMVSVHCAIESKIINFKDVYNCEGFNFEGTKKFDANTGFRSKSMLVIPMINNTQDVIGVLQLINARDSNGDTISFTKEDEEILLSLTSQAAVAITNVKMIQELKELLESFIKSIAFAVDQKSPYTGGHVQKVANISLMIADAIKSTKSGKYADIHYTEDELDEIRISALMHDVGKITTPQHIMDKATKLETIYDRINVVRIKFEVLKKDLKINMLDKKIKLIQNGASSDEIKLLEDSLEDEMDILDEEISFLVISNIGGEFMTDEHINIIKKIAQRKLILNGISQNILSDFDVKNLCIRKGTLTPKELEIMRDHAKISNEMLDALPFPKHLKRVPSIAGGHHEKLNGKGYPKGLTADELSLESRILALADIFEALSASDRPYKDGKKMSEVMKIINFMIKDGELDGDLVEFFYEQNLHLKYAKENLEPKQLDI